MRTLAIAATLVALSALPGTAQIGNPGGMRPGTPQSEPGTPAPHQPNAQDRLFCHLAATGGMAEVSAGRAAESKASNAAVKDFARRMVQEHSKASDQLTPLAKAAGVSLPETVDPDHKAQMSELDKLSGAAFDLGYMKQQLVDHQKTATVLAWEISSGQDAALQRYAMQTLPVVLEHLQMVQTVLAQLTGAAPQGLAEASPSPSASPAGGNRKPSSGR